MTTSRALIVDDEPDIRELLSITLGRMGLETDTAANITEAESYVSNTRYNICLTDMKLPDGDGIDFVRFVQERYPQLPIAVITAHGNMDTAIQALKAGAFDFVNKPIDLSALRTLVSSAINSSKISDQKDVDVGIIGESAPIASLKKSIKKLARSQAPVYIWGESGTGKEMVAKAIHTLGPRSSGPFVPVNCGAIPKDLVESEFFGHKKGAFTGASSDKPGLFQAADNGTLFLDEVADLPLDMQVKLLRAIQEKAIRPIGGQNEIKTNVRILSATHKNLQDLVSAGEFRQDLFYRLNVIQLTVPTLKERDSDIPLLVEHFLNKLDKELGDGKTTISKAALNELLAYSFPGNIRELENILERAFTLCEDDRIEQDDLLLQGESQTESATTPQSRKNHYQKSLNFASMDEYLAEVEREIITDALEHVRWNKTMAAKKLGISFRSFRYRLSKLGLGDDQEDE